MGKVLIFPASKTELWKFSNKVHCVLYLSESAIHWPTELNENHPSPFQPRSDTISASTLAKWTTSINIISDVFMQGHHQGCNLKAFWRIKSNLNCYIFLMLLEKTPKVKKLCPKYCKNNIYWMKDQSTSFMIYLLSVATTL